MLNSEPLLARGGGGVVKIARACFRVPPINPSINLAVGQVCPHPRRPLGQDLKRVPRRERHDRENPVDRSVRQIFMEQVRHRVNEDPPRLAPAQWQIECGLHQPDLAGPARLAINEMREARKWLA